MKAVIERFYDAFSRGDAAAMTACYADDVRFSDPVFGELQGERAKAMWEMLCARATDLEVTYRDVTDTSAHWEARYTFGHTGRKVHNVIDARFGFRGDLIVRHDDRFSLNRWARQALGPGLGSLTALPPVRAKVRQMSVKALDSYLAKRA